MTDSRTVLRIILFVLTVLLLGFTNFPSSAASLAADYTSRDVNSVAAQTGGDTVLRGWLSILYGDPVPGSTQPPISQFMLTDGYGLVAQLLVEHDLAQPLQGSYVEVRGQPAAVAAGAASPTIPVIVVTSIQPVTGALAAPSAATVTGSQPWVTLLCRYADDAAVPHPPSWYNPLMVSNQYPGMDHYWRQISYNQIDLIGSAVYGWYTLPQPKSYYTQPNGWIDWGKTLLDCTAVADADVNFPTFYGINLGFSSNIPTDCCVWGVKGWGVARDGPEKLYGVTWMHNRFAQNLVAHEMGHGFGLPHSAGAAGAGYSSQWDVMSGARCNIIVPEYSCVGSGTISYNLYDLLGWIPAARRFVAADGTESMVTIDRLNQPPGLDYLMAQIPIASSATQFYTVEVRRFSGYDQSVPGEGVVIHHVDTNRQDPFGNPQDPAWTIDGDGDGNSNDDGGWWVPGETFFDAAHNIQVAVLSESGSTVTVRIRNNFGSPTNTVSFTPIHDARVNSDAPNTSYGTTNPLRLRGSSSPLYNSFLKFDVTGLSGSVQRATLRLFATDGSTNGGAVYLVANTYRGTSTSWLESGLTWNNAPTIGGTPLSAFTATVPNNTWMEYDVTAAVSGNGVYSFGLTTSASNSLLMNSKEASTNRPELVVETSGVVAQPPANDDFADAINIDPLPFSDTRDDTSGATTEAGEPVPSCGTAGSTVWYRFQAGTPRTVRFATFGSYDTWLAVYTGSSLSALSQLACNDDVDGSVNSRVDVPVTQGNTYYIQIGRKGGASGTSLFFDVSVPGPANENYDSAMTISTLPFTNTQDVLGAWDHDDDPSLSCWSTGPSHSVWYRYTPQTGGIVQFNTYGSNYDTAIVVLTGSPDNFTEIACNDDYSGSNQSQVDVSLTGGVTYYVMVVGNIVHHNDSQLVFRAQPSGNTTLPVSFAPIHDARVNSDAPNTSYGTTNPLRLRGSSSPLYNSFLKFDVTGLSGSVQRATLRLFATDGSTNGGAVYLVSNAYRNTATPWLESGITWNNAPTIGGTPLSAFTATVPNNTWMEYDVTAAVSGNGVYSFGLTTSASNSLLMNSKEASTNRPELVIELSSTPPPPPNDDYRNAIEITGFPFTDTQNTTGATEFDEDDMDQPSLCDNGGGGRVWYRFRATANQTIRFDTHGSNYDTWLSLASGEELPDLDEEICNDDFDGGQTSQFDYTVTAGTHYYVMIGGLAPRGTLVFNAAVIPSVSNDDFDNATEIVLSPTSYHVTQDTSSATSAPDDPRATCWDVGANVWYRYTPTSSHVLELSTQGSNYSTWLAVFTGTRGNLTEIACNDFIEPEMYSFVQFPVTAGVTYYVMIGGDDGEAGNLEFNARIAPPANDEYRNAIEITSFPFTDTQNTIGATEEDEDDQDRPTACDNGGGGRVWYRFRATANQTIRFDTHGSSYDTWLSIASGEVMPDLIEEACNDNFGSGQTSQLDFDVTAGTHYYVMIGGPAPRGTLVFNAAVLSTSATLTFTPIHDARVNSDAPNTSYGTTNPLRLRGITAPLYNSFLKFDVTGLSGSVQRATLRLFATDGSTNGGAVYLVANAYRGTSTPWLESGITWNNAPTIGGTPLSAFTATVPNNTWIEYDVTAAVSGNGVYSFGLTTSASNSLLMNSKEASTNRPELVIETGPGGRQIEAVEPAPIEPATPLPEPVPVLVGSGQCPANALSYSITNQGDAMLEAANYAVFGPMGELPAGTLGPLVAGETVTLNFGDVPEGLYTLFAGQNGLIIAVDCPEPAADAEETATIAPPPTELAITPTPLHEVTQETIDGPPTFTPAPLPTLTPTPQPLALPFFDSLDAGQAAWTVAGAWALQDAAPSGGTGQFWNVSSSGGAVATLGLRQPLDLRTVPQPMLRFDSLLVSSQSIAQLEVSVDGQVWQPIMNVQPSAGWLPITVNLSAYQQQAVWLRWVWIAQLTGASQAADFWSVDNIAVADASLLLPTATPTIIPSLPSATPSATAVPEATDDTSQSTPEPTMVLPTETAMATTVAPEATTEQTVEPLPPEPDSQPS